MSDRGKKKHLTLEQLADFVRRVGRDDQLKAMKHHVESCEKCAKVAGTWRHVSEVANRLPQLEPPEGAVRTVKALYSIHKPERTKPSRSALADLLFDSLHAPLQAGVRSAATHAPRQLLFGSGDYRVDLRIEPQDDADTVSLLGQILHTDSSRNLGPVDVALMQGRRVLAKSQTNQLGEFHLECDLAARLELRLILPDSQVSIPLIDPVQENDKENVHLTGLNGVSDSSTRKKRWF
jgi:hypothetical protein